MPGMQACQFYVASFWLLPVSFDVFMPDRKSVV